MTAKGLLKAGLPPPGRRWLQAHELDVEEPLRRLPDSRDIGGLQCTIPVSIHFREEKR